MRRPILIAMIGYIIGILVGLYLKISIVPFCFLVIAIYKIKQIYKAKRDKIEEENDIKSRKNKKVKENKTRKKLKLLSLKRYIRYIRIYINSKIIFLILISSIISNSIIIIQNKKYEQIYNSLEKQEKINLVGIVVSYKEEKKFSNKYKIETKYNNTKIRLYIMVKKDIQLKYGDKIEFMGEYIRPEKRRNYKGFDYSNYLKQLKIYGTMKITNVKVIEERKANPIFQISNEIKTKIISNTKETLDEETSAILLGLILGNKDDIDENIEENFRSAGMAHILAVSGMHVTYVILGLSRIMKKILGKRKNYIFCICVLIVYMFITNFSASVTRAGIMGIIMILSKIFYRKNDIYTALSISLFIILIYNPFLIQSLGLLLSYGGVIGIIILNKSILSILKNIKIKNKKYKYFIKPKIQNSLDKTKEIISVSISVQIFIFPIAIYNLNTFNPYFFISNLLLSIVIGPIIIIGFLFIIVVLINYQITKLFIEPIKIGIKILIYISKIGKLPFSKIYIPTLSLFSIFIYYFIIVILLVIYKIYSTKKPNMTQIRAKNLIALIKFKIKNNIKKVKTLIIIICVVIIVISFIPRNLKIYFIDVGQGDSTLIVTPHNKTILIDGGGSENSDYDIGQNTLLPYILDRGYNTIDTIIISHFDSDHVRSDCYM